jgi:glycosyltransferase involved in cell wall biosynthesis
VTHEARTARVTMGLPVYNGERYLTHALESILAQTFTDWRLVIGDNGSTDGTPDIAARFARLDRRIEVVRRSENIGAAPNFNDLFRRTGGEYFKWAAHDDVLRPEFLSSCVAKLDADPGAVLCHTLTDQIDEEGRVTGRDDEERPLLADRASRRFEAVLSTGYPTMVWGVMRRTPAARTGLIGSFVNSDRYFLAELLLSGRFALVEEPLFAVRWHPDQFASNFERRTPAERLAWFDPKATASSVRVGAASLARLAGAIGRSDLPTRERAACLGILAGRMGRKLGRALGVGGR